MWQYIDLGNKNKNEKKEERKNVPGLHRACPPAIGKGYAEIWSPPMPLYPLMTPEGWYEIRAEATTRMGGVYFVWKEALMSRNKNRSRLSVIRSIHIH